MYSSATMKGTQTPDQVDLISRVNQIRVMRAAHQAGGHRCTGSAILTVTICLAMLVFLIQSSTNSLAECQEQLTVESRQQKDQDLTKTIDYLEKLDKYFSQIARPRFGRSGEFKRPSSMGRFSGGQPSSMEPAQFDSLVELLNGRFAKKYRDSMNY